MPNRERSNIWIDAEGSPHVICMMDTDYLLNCIWYLIRCAKQKVYSYSFLINVTFNSFEEYIADRKHIDYLDKEIPPIFIDIASEYLKRVEGIEEESKEYSVDDLREYLLNVNIGTGEGTAVYRVQEGRTTVRL